MRFFIELSYNGKAYHGWQNQPNAITVQQMVEHALSTLLSNKIDIVGAGRTDAGVHAKQMYAHFDTDEKLDILNLVYKLNAFLPKDIVVNDILEVTHEAHARFDAISRAYFFKISTKKDAFNYDYAYCLKQPLDIGKMNEASKILLDYKNFKCFSRSNTDVKTYNCDIKHVDITHDENELVFVIKADRFLRNMVRAIVGTLIEIGLGKIEVNKMHDIIRSEDRSQAGPSVPAHGLYLSEIVYPKNIFK